MNKRPLLSRLACTAALAGSLLAGAALPSQAAVASATVSAHATHQATGAKPTTTSKPAAKHTPAKHAKKTKKHAKKVVKKPAVAKANLTPFEAALLADINNARAQAGVPALTAAPGYTDLARQWTLQLAEQADLSHNPNIVDDVQADGGNSWTWIGENVGDGPANDEPGLFAAYMASPHHRDNILDPRGRYIGIGAITITDDQGNQVVYNTCDFSDAYAPAYGADKTPGLPDAVDLSTAEAAIS